ncbi:MAG: zinc ribbon domain-containing protein [bacterium]|nr:zinc ribbon domain-containing protein [bacterium]
MYEYQCQHCGHQFSVFVSLSKRDEPQVCPKCQSKESKRLVSLISSLGSSSSCGGSGRFT